MGHSILPIKAKLSVPNKTMNLSDTNFNVSFIAILGNCLLFWKPIFVVFRLLITHLLSSDYPFVIFRLLISPLLSSDYPFVIFRLLITPLVSSDYPFVIFWLPLWYLLITLCYLQASDYPFVIFRLL
jgi:hypothetical protein